MTEAEWLACTDPTPMLKYLSSRASKRKLRLFACACCWSLRSVFPTQAYHEMVETTECFAEGISTKAELDQKYRAVAKHSNSMVAMSVCGVADASASYAASKTAQRAREVAKAVGLQGVTRKSQASLLRDIFGNPFRPVALDPAWRTPTATALATAAYEERSLSAGTLDPARLAVLADALDDAGCTEAAILDHCRSPGPHVRGCFAVDLILGKE